MAHGSGPERQASAALSESFYSPSEADSTTSWRDGSGEGPCHGLVSVRSIRVQLAELLAAKPRWPAPSVL